MAGALRPTVRLRLTLIYGGGFLAAGAILLAFNYVLVRGSLDSGPRIGAVKVFAPAFVAAGPGAANEAGATVTGSGPFTIPAGSGVRVPVTKTFTLPPEAGFGPVTGTVLERPVTVEGVALADKLRDYREKVQDHTLSELVSDSAMALGGMSVLSVLLGWMVAGRVLRPLHQITATARRLSEENLHERIGLDGPHDELKELGDTFDAMLGRLETAFDGQKRFVANASHELRTPLAVMRAEVDVTLADPDATTAELRRMAETVRAASEQSEALIDGLLVLARSERGPAVTEAVDLAAVAGDAAAQAAGEADRAGVRLELDFRPAPVTGDASLLGRLAGNLLENAVRHNTPGGDGWVRARTAVRDGEAVLTVSNSGPAVPAEAVEGLFEPFRRLAPDRTGARAGRGAGLGLSIVRSVAAAHGGRVAAVPRPEGGLDVTVTLPAR